MVYMKRKEREIEVIENIENLYDIDDEDLYVVYHIIMGRECILKRASYGNKYRHRKKPKL